MENHQKWTENRSIRGEQDHLSHVNQRLKLLQEKLVRGCVAHEVNSRTATV